MFRYGGGFRSSGMGCIVFAVFSKALHSLIILGNAYTVTQRHIPEDKNSKYNGCRHPKSHLSYINASGRNVLPDQTNFKIQSQGYNKQKNKVPSWDVHRK
jgi:hypothetical protein